MLAKITSCRNDIALEAILSISSENSSLLEVFFIVVLFFFDYYVLCVSYSRDDFTHRAVGGKPLLVSYNLLHRSAS
jgi:hypothetical protein